MRPPPAPPHSAPGPSPAQIRFGVMVHTDRGYGRGILRGVLQFAREHPDWQFVHESNPGLDGLRRLIERERVTAILTEARDPALVAAMARRRIPFVLVASSLVTPGLRPPLRVTVDNRAIGRVGFDHLRELGFRSFAFLPHPGAGFSTLREEGFTGAAREAGFAVARFPVRAAPDSRREAVLARWLAGLRAPVGLMAANDGVAAAVIRAAVAAGRSVPEELGVLGVDNDALTCELIHPTLSSIDPGVFDVGYRAADLAARALLREPIADRDLHLPPRGVVSRESTATLAVPDPNVRAALRVIRERACGDLSIAEVVRASHLSRRSLEMRFKAVMGRTLQDQITRVRLARAKELLSHTDMLTPDIAAECGWSSASRMSIIFRRLVGTTPSAYRLETASPSALRHRRPRHIR